jgi:hypothetical protein
MKAALAVSLLALLVCTGCAQRSGNAQSRASAAQIEACRRSADQTVLAQNPNAIYQSDAYVSGTQSTPFSGQGLSSSITTGLPQRYSREQYYDNCLNGIGPAPAAFAPGPTAAPAPPPRTVTSSPLMTAPPPGMTAPPPSATVSPPSMSAPPANLAAPPPSLTSRPPP